VPGVEEGAVITAHEFERMVEAHQHRIFGFALSLSGNPADAEEIAQDAFVRAHRALTGYDADRVRELKVSAWLHRIALNVFRNRVRRRLRETVPLDSIAEPHSNGLLPDELHDLRAAVLGLPARYREAVILRHVQGFNYDEIAEVLGVPSGTAKSDVHRGLAILKEELR
jgi:RNA polymerase sigma-70 factor (ECF subfamily)